MISDRISVGKNRLRSTITFFQRALSGNKKKDTIKIQLRYNA